MTQTLLKRRTVLAQAAAATAVLGAPLAARAQAPATRILLGYTAVSDFTAAFCAKEEGFFSKRGLDVELQLIQLNPMIPAAMQSNSIQIGGPTPPVMIQAVDGGLDLVAIAGGSVTSRTATNYGLVARTGVAIRTAQDCVGKKIGVPGLGAFLHVLFRKWLTEKGVNFRQVQFIETAFPQHNDVLRGGSVDAVVTADPFMARIVAGGAGGTPIHFASDLPDGQPAILYSATRAWATANAAQVRAFREAITEGVTFVNANLPKAREHLGKYTRLPPEILATVQISTLRPTVSVDNMRFWIEVMRAQEMLKTSIDPTRLLA
ncbi:MAG: ABC transporter substrate-binding protein [Rubrivivax sp.]|jgi:NitT/TauT family transport system substrate-binding protein|nr:ABC transporter substrate-binding protein [Rubrivivax sp.]